METITFRVQGSASEPYVTTFKREGAKLKAHCSCPAGEVGQCCKHRLNIFQGATEGIVSGNETEVQVVVAWLKGSDVERALQQVREAESRLEDAKKQLNGSKKALARVLA
jgi:uncharacterized Zn finger protein